MQEAHEAYDVLVLEELTQLDPEMRAPWSTANEAREARDFEAAIAAYSVLVDALPEFDHALRRRCSVYLVQERYSYALDDCRAAYELNPRAENAAALAVVLASAPSTTIGDPERASQLAATAYAQASEDMGTVSTVCQVAIGIQDMALLGRCSTQLRALDAESWEGHLFSAIHHMLAGRTADAERSLERAHALGLVDEVYTALRADLQPPVSPELWWAQRIGAGVGLWLLFAGLLVGAGFGLSRLTLREAESVVTKGGGSARASDSRLHRAYALVMWLACAYYYVSVPLILLLLLALGGGLIALVIMLGRIPIKLLVIVGVVVFGTIGAVLKSLFKRPSNAPPGEKLELEADAPGLRATLDEVAAKVGTRSVDTVYLAIGTELAVFERGGMLAKLRGKGERCLLLGVAALEGLDLQAFKAILAHEYGHFSNEDTAGGNFALGVRRSIIHTAQGLAEAGAADWYNPVWVFLRGFNQVFLRISQGASRLQEVLADRWAVRSYGAQGFERGLRHVIEASMRFDVHASMSINEILQQRRGLRNLYSYEPADAAKLADIDFGARVEEAVNAETSPYNSHPRPADRFRWAHAMAAEQREGEDAATPSWSLFRARADIEQRMTAVVRENVAENTGQVIPEDPEGRVRRQKRLDF